MDANCWMHVTRQTCTLTSLDSDTLSVLLHRLHPWINNYCIMTLLCSYSRATWISNSLADYIMKNDIQIHAGVQTLQAVLNSNTDKF